jgi:hypothetical protein
MNPFNPLNWLKSAQDWFRTAELSSGFRPYLVFFLLVCGIVFSLLTAFSSVLLIVEAALLLLVVSAFAFILLFAIKAFQDPHFCRSEKHIERVIRMEMELMGSDTRQLEAEVVEAELTLEATPDQPALPAAENE